jgi:hypothetical protein
LPSAPHARLFTSRTKEDDVELGDPVREIEIVPDEEPVRMPEEAPAEVPEDVPA